MEEYSENQVQKLKNNLLVTSLIKNTNKLLDAKNELNNKNKNNLERIQKDKKLYGLNFGPKYENIKKLYELAINKFKGQNEVSVSSYGLSIISDHLIIYITKQIEESLKYISNEHNISPVEYKKYANLSKSNATSEMLLNGGLNLFGYSFEFNLNYFLQTLSDMVELPNLMIDLGENYYNASFKELDLAYYNIDTSINDNINLLQCNIHFKIQKENVKKDDDNKFRIYENSLILGEVKSRFPKKIDDDGKYEKEDSLEKIISKLFEKLHYFFQLYKKIGLFNYSTLKNIQIIFFYDSVNLKGIDEKTIEKYIIKYNDKNKYLAYPSDVPIHFFIVYVLPAITNISIYGLKNEINLIKEETKRRDEEAKRREEEAKRRDEEAKRREEEAKRREEEAKRREDELKMEIDQLKRLVKDLTNKIEENEKKNQNFGVLNHIQKENNKINPVVDDVYPFINEFNISIKENSKEEIKKPEANLTDENNKKDIFNFWEELNKIQFSNINPKNEIKESNNIDTNKYSENTETDISKLILNINDIQFNTNQVNKEYVINEPKNQEFSENRETDNDLLKFIDECNNKNKNEKSNNEYQSNNKEKNEISPFFYDFTKKNK